LSADIQYQFIMKKEPFFGVVKYTALGFMLGVILIILGMVLNYVNGFKGPWFHIFEFAPDFVIIVFSPLFLSMLFYFIGFKKEQLVLFNREIKQSLSQEQSINSAADTQLRLLAKVVAQVNESIVISNGLGLVEWVNDGFTRNCGYTLEEVRGKNLSDVLHGPLTDTVAVKRMVQNLLRGEAVTEELLVYHKDGEAIWLSVSIKPICDDTGEILNFIAIHKNVTGRKEKEIAIESLYKEVSEYKFALDQSAIVIVFNNKGKVIHVNRKFCELNEMAEDELLGNDYRTISLSMRNKAVVRRILAKLLDGKTWKGELVNRNSNGKSYCVDTTIVPLMDAEGRPNKFLAIQQDITERKTLQVQLISNKNRLQQAMQVARLGSWEISSNGVLTVSRELRLLYKLPMDGPVGMEDIFSKMPQESIETINAGLTKCCVTLQKIEVEFRIMLDGEEHYMMSNINPFVGANGTFNGTFGTVQDITGAKLAAIALRKSEEEKAVVLNNTQAIICLHDMNGVLLDINATAEKVTGYAKKEVVGVNVKLILPDEYQDDFDAYIEAINKNSTARGTLEIYTKNRSKRVWLYQNTVYDNNGNDPYVIASAIDITESVTAQKEIARQQQFIRQIIDNSPNVIFMLNDQRQIMLANQTFSKYYPYNQNEVPEAESLSSGAGDIFLGDIDKLFELEEGQMIRVEGSVKNPETKNLSWFNIINKCFYDRNGRKYILGFGMDITGRHQVESDLLAANELVERSLKVKEQFISNMSHEIRTPLNAVIGFNDLLSDTPLNEEQTEYVEIIKTASGNLLALINNVLDLSKIESSNLSIESLPIDISKIVRDVMKILGPKATAKGIRVSTNIDEQIPSKVMGDELRLTQILLNLLGNAVKFTDNGSIDITCNLAQGTDKKKDYISFSITDTGIGVEKDKQKSIFERFTQANSDTQRLYGGTGLGLNITRSLVDLYGGTLNMKSEPGKGTTFNFILPFKRYVESKGLLLTQALTIDNVLSVNTNSPIHILLAEDNMVNALLATKVLTMKGFTVVHVINGLQALEALQQQYFDVVLMDIQMPVMNGISAAGHIRALPGRLGSIPIIAMTAHSLNGEMENCYKAGMNGYIAKPFKPNDLFNSIIESVKKDEIIDRSILTQLNIK
jgi:PAS domain S-box-containing protein